MRVGKTERRKVQTQQRKYGWCAYWVDYLGECVVVASANTEEEAKRLATEQGFVCD